MNEMYRVLLIIWLIPIVALSKSNVLPERTIENVADGVIVTYNFREPIIQPNHLVPGSFLWKYMGFGINDTSGEPAVPFRSDVFYIPRGYASQVDITDTIYNDTTLILSPSIPCHIKNEMPELIDSIRKYHGFFPENVIKQSPIDDYRGIGLQRIIITPVQYNNEHHIVRFYSMIKYKISFILKDTNKGDIPYSKKNSRKINNFLSKIVLNYNDLPSTLSRGELFTVPDTTNYLIITVNDFLDSLQSFIEWKRIKGNRVFIQSKNRGEWTTDSIKDVINHLDSLHTLDYVLLVGGFDDVPADSFSYNVSITNYDGVTDYEYGLPTGNLQIPKISRGRIPVNSSQELCTILKKITKYERAPIRDVDFYKRALHCGEFSDYNTNKYEDACCIQTNENIREHLLHNYGFLINRSYYFFDFAGGPNSTDILHWNNILYGYGAALPDSLQPSAHFEWKANNVLSRINEGVLYVLYNGHGSIGGWQAPSFTTDVNNLHNGNKQPIIFSFACLTGKYNENGDCFVEKILKKGDGGCVGIFAATESSMAGYDDAMAYGIFDAIWPNLQLVYDFNWYSPDLYTHFVNPVYELGKVLDLGFLRMSETFGHLNSERRKVTMKLFHYFGDPSMMIYTDVPQDFDSPIIKYTSGKIRVISPSENTRITFYTPSDTQPIVDTFIGDSIDYETNADSVIICLDKHNYVPYIQTFYKDLYIQNETINSQREYVGKNILIGNHVTEEKPVGDVLIEDANVTIQGKSVTLHSGTRIGNSRVKINTR